MWSASWPSSSPQARATAAGSAEDKEVFKDAALRFAFAMPPVGTTHQLARITACDPATLKSRMSTFTPKAPLDFDNRG